MVNLISASFKRVCLLQKEPLKASGGSGTVGVRLQGTPVYSGTVMGRACVVTSLEQIGELTHGDILITHSTDVGWSPYFPLLEGVVTELGGLISHGEYASSFNVYLFSCLFFVQLLRGDGDGSPPCLCKTYFNIILQSVLRSPHSLFT